MFRADLHCHSTCSDGTYTPEELLRLAKEVGLSGLSITDHDTLAAYTPSLFSLAKELGILLGTGVEFSCAFKNIHLHLLAYDCIVDDPGLQGFCAKHAGRRVERNARILEKLKKMGMPISQEELVQAHPLSQTLGRPHIAKCMIDKGYVKNYKEAFSEYLGDGKKAYDEGESFSAEETISIIKAARGKAFLAHPHLLDRPRLIEDILTLSLDGIECRYAKFMPAEEKKWSKIADTKGLLKSGGSDFHGVDKAYLPLGSSWVDEPTFFKIFTRN